jgi:hypothetical protein
MNQWRIFPILWRYQYLDCVALNDTVIAELERIWSELKKTQKSSISVARGPAEIRTNHLPNTDVECYRYPTTLVSPVRNILFIPIKKYVS